MKLETFLQLGSYIHYEYFGDDPCQIKGFIELPWIIEGKHIELKELCLLVREIING